MDAVFLNSNALLRWSMGARKVTIGIFLHMNPDTLSESIKEKALELGASLVGIADVNSVLKSPVHQENSGAYKLFKSGSFIILALEHPVSDPSLDWWKGKGSAHGWSGYRQVISLRPASYSG
jgi:hypothetical protein